jgi:predicted RNA methylase
MIFLIPPRDLPCAASPCQETRSHAKDSILLLAKAQIKNANTGDLFAVPVSIPAYVRAGHVVAPHVAIRHKAPAEVSHARALIIPAHKPEPAPPNTAELIWRQGALEDPPGAPPAPTRNFGWDAVKLSNAYSTDELNAMYRVLARDPAGHNPEHAQGQSIHIYTPSTRKKMDAIAWAITYHLKDKNHAASGNRDGSFKGEPLVVVTTPPVDLKAEAQRAAQAKKLREGAQSHLAQAEEDLGRDRQSNTARRARMAAGSIKDAQQRALIAGTMNNIADLIEAGEAVLLAGISTRAQVEALDLVARQSVYGWERDTNQPYHGDREIIPELKHVPHAKLPAGEWNVKERARLERMGLKTNQDLQAALREYLPLRSERRREDPIKAAERALVGTKPGIDFFPTPPPLAQRMVQLANVNPGEHVLEPSAGKGDIADAIRSAGGKVDVVELSNTLRAVLEAKGHKLVGTDFETFEPTEPYDAIVMNPPWSGGADVRHVMRAYDMLKPGGRLVALMSMHASFASDKASVAFRGWMEELGASSEKHGAEDFKSQWMSGGIPSWLVSVRKPMTKAMFFKAQIKGANTGDLFSQPVNVRAYVRNGHTVAAHTEVRQVRHEAPPAPKPPAPAEDKPSAGITHFYVSAVDGGKKHLVAGPYATLEEAKAMVEGVRKHADSDPRAHFMAWGTAGTDREHKTPLGKWAPAAAKPKPALIIKKRPDMTEAEAEAFAREVSELPRNKLTGKTQMDDDAKAMFAKKKLSKKDVDLIVRKMVEAKQRPAA